MTLQEWLSDWRPQTAAELRAQEVPDLRPEPVGSLAITGITNDRGEAVEFYACRRFGHTAIVYRDGTLELEYDGRDWIEQVGHVEAMRLIDRGGGLTHQFRAAAEQFVKILATAQVAAAN